MTAFDFGVPFQRSVLRLCMLDEAFCAKAQQYLRAEHFTQEPLGWIWRTQSDYWRAYMRRLTDVPLLEALRRLPEDRQLLYAPEAQAVMALEVPEADWLKEQVRDFVRRQIFAVAHREAADLFNLGQEPAAYDVMAKAQDRIQQVDFDSLDRQWYFEELADRYEERIRMATAGESDVFRTGIDPLDQATGGVQPGEVWVMLAYAKRCKTTWLINQGWSATYVDAQPTVHFVLEGKGAQIAARYDALFSGELYASVKRGEMSAGAFRYLAGDFARRRRLLVIRTLNDWDVTVMHLQSELAELKAMGFRPRMSILDYMDLGRARDKVATETQHQLCFARDYKRLCLQWDLASWSAWQAVRPREGAHDREHILTSASIADAYAKARIVDLWGSLNATDDEMRRGEMRLFVESHRDAPVNQLYRITNDLSRMKMAVTWHRIRADGTEEMDTSGVPDAKFADG